MKNPIPEKRSDEQVMEEFDRQQRLFVAGRLHSVHWNKWMEQLLLERPAPQKDTQSDEEIEEHEMTPFEAQLAQRILAALEYRGFYDCGKYLDTSLIEHLRPLLTHLSQEAEERGARRAMEIIEELEEEDTEGIGWDMFFEKEGTEPCCPGDDWGCVYKMALRKIKQTFTNH